MRVFGTSTDSAGKGGKEHEDEKSDIQTHRSRNIFV